MPSDTVTTEKVKIEEPAFRLEIDTPAGEAEQKSFWNQLRRFYRTGEKHKTKSVKFRSAFSRLPDLQGNEAFPFRVNDSEFQFCSTLPFDILNLHITVDQNIKVNNFKLKLRDLIAGLEKLLEVKDSRKDTGEVYDFASEIIAFDKLSGLVPTKEGDKFTPGRSKQLTALIEDLKEGLKSYEKEEAVVLDAGKALRGSNVFNKAKVIVLEESRAFQETEKELKKQMNRFVSLIRSLRIAELQVNGEYREEIHQDFYTHFSWYRLTELEKGLFHPVILVLDHRSLINQLDAYTKLLSLNWPVKLLVLNQGLVSEPDQKTDWEEASHRFRQELSTLTISHRNVLVFQSALAHPEQLSEGLNSFIKSNNPSIAHLLIPKDNKAEDVMVSRGAVSGRHFPVITYDPYATGNRLRLVGNDAIKSNWSKYEISYTTGAGGEHVEKIQSDFTYADYKAFFENKVAELMIVPPAHDSKDLVILSDYLSMKENELVGKLPYIWLTDAKGNLTKAVVPNVWVVSCQERLDFWNFLQELGNVSAQIKEDQEVKEVKQEGKKPTTDKMIAIRAAHEHELKKVREEAISQAAGQLLQALLNSEDPGKG